MRMPPLSRSGAANDSTWSFSLERADDARHRARQEVLYRHVGWTYEAMQTPHVTAGSQKASTRDLKEAKALLEEFGS